MRHIFFASRYVGDRIGSDSYLDQTEEKKRWIKEKQHPGRREELFHRGFRWPRGDGTLPRKFRSDFRPQLRFISSGVLERGQRRWYPSPYQRYNKKSIFRCCRWCCFYAPSMNGRVNVSSVQNKCFQYCSETIFRRFRTENMRELL